jgi:hypothetical protein
VFWLLPDCETLAKILAKFLGVQTVHDLGVCGNICDQIVRALSLMAIMLCIFSLLQPGWMPLILSPSHKLRGVAFAVLRVQAGRSESVGVSGRVMRRNAFTCDAMCLLRVEAYNDDDASLCRGDPRHNIGVLRNMSNT